MKGLFVFTLLVVAIAAQCSTPCAEGQICCGTTCVPNQESNTNCGQCGLTCGGTGKDQQTCKAGKCTCVSEQFTLKCGSQCVDPTSIQTCGGCRNTCASGQTCSGGKCVCGSNTLIACSEGCFSLTQLETEPDHCGKPVAGKVYDPPCSFAVKCAPGEFCTGGKCTSSECVGYPAGSKFCHDTNTCHDFETDNKACGECSRQCDTAGTKCVEGKCINDPAAVGADASFTLMSNGANQYTDTVTGADIGLTRVVRSNVAHKFTNNQEISVLITINNLPTGWEVHVYASQEQTDDRARLRATSIPPLLPATLTSENSSVRFTTTAEGKITYMYVFRKRGLSTRDVEQNDRPTVSTELTISEAVVARTALGRVNVNLSFAGMYTGL